METLVSRVNWPRLVLVFFAVLTVATTVTGPPTSPATSTRTAAETPLGLTPAPTTTHVVDGSPENADELVATLRAAGFTGQGLRTAWAVTMRESGGNAHAVGSRNSDGTYDYGLFQLNDAHRSHIPNFDACVTDAYCSAVEAYKLSDGGTDFSDWAVGTNGWAGYLYRTAPTAWRQLNETLQAWETRFPDKS